jgi:hypothetical protein
MQKIEQKQVERVSTEDDQFSVEVSAGVSLEAEGLQDSLADIADSFDVTGFKCVKCGMVHKHDTTKHQLSKDFDISDSDAVGMEYNSVCHCGLQEAARHGSDLGVDQSKAANIASSAPIPPEVSREMNDTFGAL